MERAGIPTALLCNLVSIAERVGAPRIVRTRGIPYPTGDPSLDADAEKRWRVTLPFGFIHGFGFAGALLERHLPRPRLPLALLGFNTGVEVGQLAVMALVLPLVIMGRRNDVVRLRAVPVANVIVVVLGLAWLGLRLREALR